MKSKGQRFEAYLHRPLSTPSVPRLLRFVTQSCAMPPVIGIVPNFALKERIVHPDNSPGAVSVFHLLLCRDWMKSVLDIPMSWCLSN